MLIEQPWGVSAFGQGTVHAEPDHAVLRIAVNRLSNNPQTSLEEAKKAVSAVRNALRTRRIPEADVTSSRIRVHSAWDGFGSNRKFLGHQCRVEFSVRIAELDAVEPVVVDLVTAGADEIVSVTYDTNRTPELRADARRQAVAVAQAKAQVYADAAGVPLGPVVHIEDVDPERLRTEVHRGMGVGGSPGGGDTSLRVRLRSPPR
jgi:uncharacterized protein YggE